MSTAAGTAARARSSSAFTGSAVRYCDSCVSSIALGVNARYEPRGILTDSDEVDAVGGEVALVLAP